MNPSFLTAEGNLTDEAPGLTANTQRDFGKTTVANPVALRKTSADFASVQPEM